MPRISSVRRLASSGSESPKYRRKTPDGQLSLDGLFSSMVAAGSLFRDKVPAGGPVSRPGLLRKSAGDWYPGGSSASMY